LQITKDNVYVAKCIEIKSAGKSNNNDIFIINAIGKTKSRHDGDGDSNKCIIAKLLFVLLRVNTTISTSLSTRISTIWIRHWLLLLSPAPKRGSSVGLIIMQDIGTPWKNNGACRGKKVDIML